MKLDFPAANAVLLIRLALPGVGVRVRVVDAVVP
jgi:hypothetical protein